MKTTLAILAAASILSITSAAPSPIAAAAAAKPTGYLEVYQTPDCTATEGLEPKNYNLIEAQCVNLSPSAVSVQAGINADEPCPKGTTAIVRIFEGIGCTEQTLETSKLPADGSESECQNTVFVPNLPAGEGVDVDGKSAQLACVEN